jgi:hypothetical protein
MDSAMTRANAQNAALALDDLGKLRQDAIRVLNGSGTTVAL